MPLNFKRERKQIGYFKWNIILNKLSNIMCFLSKTEVNAKETVIIVSCHIRFTLLSLKRGKKGILITRTAN